MTAIDDVEPDDLRDEHGYVAFMRQLVSVEYATLPPSATTWRVAEAVKEGRVLGHRCPRCSKVYVPPRGYCSLCVVPTGEDDEVDVADRGTVTAFTIITPIQYHGQQETEDYAQASVLLDGANQTIMTRLDGIPTADVHTGMRVRARWKPVDARGFGFADSIDGWEPTGEADTPPEAFAEHII